MATTVKEERLKWVIPIMEKTVRLVDVAAVCPYSKRSIERWVAIYKKRGAAALEPKSTRPKTNPKETAISIKEDVIALRNKTKLCALKLHWKLEKQGIRINERTIGKILKAEGLVRKYRVKKITYKYIRSERKPGELIEIDVKHVPGLVAGKPYFQYTAIDTASRWRYLRTFDEESTYHTCLFLLDVLSRFPYRITGVKTDNHATFTNRYHYRAMVVPMRPHALDLLCAARGIAHYLIDPGKPAQNGTVERSHREDQEKFYEQNTFASVEELKEKMCQWNMQYNDLEHCGLNGKTPNEALALFALTNPPNVCA
jgi:transposase InsO family protein